VKTDRTYEYLYGERKPHSTIMLVILSTLLVVMWLASAYAGETVSTTCEIGTAFYPAGCNTVYGYNPGAGPRIIDVRRPIDEEQDRKWVAFCKPRFETRKYGVQYYVFAHEGCEYGRTE
jgi:hypothetical protein